MKKINILIIFALIFLFSPLVSSADQNRGEEKGNDNAPVPTLFNEAENDETVPTLISSEEKEDSDMEESDDIEDVDENDDMELSDSDDEVDTEANKRGEERKSQVAKAALEMIQTVEGLSNGIGNQIRVIAQEQKENHEMIEENIKNASKRGGFARFFIGPDYTQIKEAEKYIEKYNSRLEEIKEISSDQFENAIKEMEEARDGLMEEIEAQKGGFSLFGWLSKLFVE